ncbi:L-fucose:H+ symporter permease [Phenylobacterium montanum]|uniref:L-fucose:H+ symporter permease n=1 Tax=Phenylobacterium montanum TaxID=2823693 RepID=A0A975IUM7_9CAUL|nr:L-fucose:H+ symporter permease [Caulobacter sp. S6]QUD87689.1 L-fucose:H+ symporter permease [Caulobacter sp. S6]
MTGRRLEGAERARLVPLILIVSLFFLWGMANNLNDVLIAQFRKAFSLGDLQSGLVQSAFYLGYFLLALPAAMFMRRFGYRVAVMLGLALYGLGALLFFPAAEVRLYSAFLGALFVIAAGLAFLETSANPLMLVMGEPEGAARRLNLAQAFNPLGSITGVIVGRQFIFSAAEPDAKQLAAMPPPQLDALHAAQAHAVQGPYLVIGLFVLVWGGLIALTRFPTAASDHAASEQGTMADVRALLARPRYLFGVLAQFFYVGAQVGVWSFLIRYAEREVGSPERAAAGYLIISLVVFMAGRFVGSALMGRVSPARLTALFGAINVGLCLVGVLAPGMAGLIALVAASFFMSVMYPTIFALSVEGLGPLTKIGASFLVMAIIGGAVLTAAMGWISDRASIAAAMAVPALAFAVVAAFALTAGRRTAAAGLLAEATP